MHPAALPEARLLAECSVTATRRGGPGGQHRNKVSTAIVIRHLPSRIEAQASERRDQQQNRRVAIQRLRLRLALAVRNPARTDEGLLATPLAAWLNRIGGRRLSISPDHEDFPALLAQALDWCLVEGWRLEPVAAHLGITTSQLVKFFQSEPAAWQLVNRSRLAAGLNRLK